MSDSGDGEADRENQLTSDVVTKYKAAAEICNKAIAAVLDACVEGAKVVDLCRLGDDTLASEAASVFKGKKGMEKGIAFPTCVSPNSVVGHLSPLADDGQTPALKAGDVVKVDLGAHIDGYIATQAATRVVGAPMDAPCTGRAADAIAAARAAFDAALRLMRPGKRIADVSDILAKCVEPFGCNLVEGVMSHQVKRHVVDGSKCVLNRPSPEHRVEDGEFEAGEVYAVDVVVSTGEGHARVKDERETSVFKRAVDIEYRCKLKAARAVLSELSRSASPSMLFTMRRLKEQAAAGKGEGGGGGEPLTDAQLRMGLTECLTHGLLHAYPVLHEKQPAALVAQFKGTVLLMPGGASDVITLAPAQAVDTAGKAVEDKDALAVLASSLKPKKKKANKAGGGGGGGGGEGAAKAEAAA